MRRLTCIWILCCLPLLALAQRETGWQIRGGFGFAGYGSTAEWKFTDFEPNLVLKDDDGAATLHAPIEIRYEVSSRVNLGLDFKVGSYLYDPDSAEGKSNNFIVAGAAVEYNFIDKEDFRWYGGLGFNGSWLELEERYENQGMSKLQVARYSGPGFRMNTGVLIFLSSLVGLNFNLGYDSHSFTLRELEVNGQLQNLEFFEATLDVKGVDGTLGIVLRLQ